MSELTKALVKFHKEVGTIHKNATAQYGKFADLANVLSTVIPPLANNGLVLTQSYEPSEGFEPILVTTLRHESGETIESRMPMVINKGRNILHDTGAAITYLRRYQIVSLLGLVADVDTDGAFVEEEPQKSRANSTAKKEAPKAAKNKPLSDQPLTAEERDTILQVLHERHNSKPADVVELQKKFVAHFKLDPALKLSKTITSQEHVQFINDNLKPL